MTDTGTGDPTPVFFNLTMISPRLQQYEGRLVATALISIAVIAILQTEQGQKLADAYVFKPARAFVGGLFAVGGFVKNFVVELVTTSNPDEWKNLLEGVHAYLETSTVGEDFKEAMNERFVFNLGLLADIREGHPEKQDLKSKISTKDLPTNQEAQRFMKYATAVYGSDMINSVKLDRNEDPFPSDYTTQDAIVAYMEDSTLSAKDLVLADMEMGDSLEYMRHMVVVDHAQKAIVLAVRGTYSLSSAIIDVEAFSAPFCNGQAHAGFAKMARATWNRAKAEIIEELNKKECKGYDIVVTGHSLGAGVSCLITILLHWSKEDKALLPPNTTVRCMAFAPPPVFCPLEAAPEAVQNTTAYIHDHDIVPSLSIHALRRFLQVVVEMDHVIREYDTKTGLELYTGISEPSKELIQTIQGACQKPALQPKEGAPVLTISAKAIVWLVSKKIEETEKDPLLPKEISYDEIVLDPTKYANRTMIMHPNMIADHMTPKYTDGLAKVATSKK